MEGTQQQQIDYLTGCFSREALDPFLSKVICETKLHKKGFSVALLDLDHFKKYNDKYGHLFGDNLLRYASSTIRLTLGDKARIFRYGGDEFVAVFLGESSKDVARLARLCNINTATRLFLYQGNLYKVTNSCGIARFPDDGETSEELLRKADQAMYFSKRYGGNLTTEAGKIGYIKLRNILAVIIGACAIFLFTLTLNRYFYQDFFQNIANRIKNIKVITRIAKLDTIVSNSGEVFKGYITQETDEVVVISLQMQRGKASITLKKPEIAEIRYGSKSK